MNDAPIPTADEEEGAGDGAPIRPALRGAGRGPGAVHDARGDRGGHSVRSPPQRGHRRIEGGRPGMRHRHALHRILAPGRRHGYRLRLLRGGSEDRRDERRIPRRGGRFQALRHPRCDRRGGHRRHEPPVRMPAPPRGPPVPGEGPGAVRMRLLHPHGRIHRIRRILRREARQERGLAQELRVRHPAHVPVPPQGEADRGSGRGQDRPRPDATLYRMVA